MTSHTSAIDGYLKKVTKGLVCLRSTKKRIANGLKQEFCEQTEESDPVRLFGEPGALAASLQDDIPPDEEAAARRRRKCLIALGILATILLIAGLTYWLILGLQCQPTRVVETIYDVEYFEIG